METGTRIISGLLRRNRRLPTVARVAGTMLVLVVCGFSTAVGELAGETPGGKIGGRSQAVPLQRRDLVITRSFDAPVATVWKAWTDPQQVMRWWGPKDFTSHSCKIDFRQGGKYLFHMRAPQDQGGQDYYTTGVFKKIVPMKLIEMSQSLADKDGNRIDPVQIGMPVTFPKEIRTTLAFKATGNKTELTVTEYDWIVGQMREMSEMGMNQCLDKLAQVLK